MKRAGPNKRYVPWTLQKRVVVAAIGTLAIMIVAHVIGGGGYVVGQAVGLIKPSGFGESEIVQKLMNDPRVVQAIYTEATGRECINDDWGVRFRYAQPLEVMTDQGILACSQWQLPGADGMPVRIIVTPSTQLADILVDQELTGLSSVLTENVQYHENLVGTRIQGIREGKKFVAYVLDNYEKRLVIQIMPANELYRLELEEWIKNMVF